MLVAKAAYNKFGPEPKPDAWDNDFWRYAITAEWAARRGFQLPPGHPKPHHLYQRHPLGARQQAKHNVYLPYDRYEEILYEERKAELTRLLIDLGATRVASVSEQASTTERSFKVGIQRDTASSSAGMGQYNASTSEEAEVFELSGKPWHRGSRLDRSAYEWLAFEPSWEAIVNAREIAGCLSASVHFRGATETKRNFDVSATLKEKVANAGFNGNHTSQTSVRTTRRLDVTFAPPID
ncbi:hypothetical protein [Caballeronia sp. GAWG2-1]|uniref:hypothetical protein n=1 Tax=Caballeronia sp. GAWG2-1 TaxID=2921744 RepID=UPI00202823F5|nr:hypothetical protein [Caballeronia sp. GAWG2-1]